MWFIVVDPYILITDADGLRSPATVIGPFNSHAEAGAWVAALPDPGFQPARATFTAHMVTSPNVAPAVD